jgi:hypothetical protein
MAGGWNWKLLIGCARPQVEIGKRETKTSLISGFFLKRSLFDRSVVI